MSSTKMLWAFSVLTVLVSAGARAELRCSRIGIASSLNRLDDSQVIEIGFDGLTAIHPSRAQWSEAKNGSLTILKEPQETITFKGNGESDSKDLILKNPDARLASNHSETPNNWGLATRVRLKASSSNPDQVHQLVIGGSENPLVLEFKAPQKPTDITIELPQELKEQDLVKFALRWPPKSKNVDLSIRGPIVFERDIFVDSWAREYLLTQKYSENSQDTFLHHELLEMAIRNLNDPQKQEMVFKIAEKGLVKSELNKIEVETYHASKDRLNPVVFFAWTQKYPSKHKIARVPVDGESNIHALQLLTMVQGMSRQQIKAFLTGPYLGMFDFNPELWVTWELLFDAPGNSLPNTKLWWKAELEKRRIPTLTN